MTQRSKTVDRLVGIFIILPVVLVGLLVVGLAKQKGWFERWITIRAPFPEGTIVPLGTRVTFGVEGDEIGHVESVATNEIPVLRVKVDKGRSKWRRPEDKDKPATLKCTLARLRVRKRYAGLPDGIKCDSAASLVRPYFNMVGDPVVHISLGCDKESPAVADKGLIALGEEGQDLTPDKLRDVIVNLADITKNANVMLQPDSPAQRILARSDKLLADLVAAEEKLAVVLSDDKAFQKQVNDRIAAGAVDILRTLREQHAAVPITHEGGELQMRFNPKLQGQVDQMIAMAEKLDKMFDQLTKTDNTLSLLMRNREFYDRTLDLVADTRTMMSDMRELMANLRKISPDLGAMVSSGRTMLDRGSRLLEGLESNPFLGTPVPVPRPGPPTDVEQRFTGPEPGAAKPAPPPTGRK